jgi:hypothetical protein
MRKDDRGKLAAEWNEIVKDHPAFAQLVLAEQIVLIEASQLGLRHVDDAMGWLLDAGLPVLFADYWERRRGQRFVVVVPDAFRCLRDWFRHPVHGSPADCFGTNNEEGWFDDPLTEERTIPPKPPVPPLRPEPGQV